MCWGVRGKEDEVKKIVWEGWVWWSEGLVEKWKGVDSE